MMSRGRELAKTCRAFLTRRGGLNDWVRISAVVGIALALANPAFAQGSGDAERAETVRKRTREEKNKTASWMPSVSISWGIYTQSIDGDTTASETNLSPATGDSYISTLFQFDGKLHTPLQLDIPTKPRLFLTAGFVVPLSDELIAARIDDSYDRINDIPPITDFADNCPDTIPLPDPLPSIPPSPLARTCSLKIRNRVTIDAMWFVGFGVDFTLPVMDEVFHISPAFEYYGLSAHTVGDFQRSSSGLGLNDFVETANAVGNSEIYHGVSTSLTATADLYESGPWKWSMFLQSRVVFLLTDPLTKVSSSLETNEITFVSHLDDFAVQGTGGFQLQWTGRNRR